MTTVNTQNGVQSLETIDVIQEHIGNAIDHLSVAQAMTGVLALRKMTVDQADLLEIGEHIIANALRASRDTEAWFERFVK